MCGGGFLNRDGIISSHRSFTPLLRLQSFRSFFFLPFPSFFSSSSLIRGENVLTEGLSLSIPLFLRESSHLSQQPADSLQERTTRAGDVLSPHQSVFEPCWGKSCSCSQESFFCLFHLNRNFSHAKESFFVFNTFSSVASCK